MYRLRHTRTVYQISLVNQQGQAAFNESTPTQSSNNNTGHGGGHTPTLNAEQSLENENITTLIACTGKHFTATKRHKQHGGERNIVLTLIALYYLSCIYISKIQGIVKLNHLIMYKNTF
jgi:hypothetical protein